MDDMMACVFCEVRCCRGVNRNVGFAGFACASLKLGAMTVDQKCNGVRVLCFNDNCSIDAVVRCSSVCEVRTSKGQPDDFSTHAQQTS